MLCTVRMISCRVRFAGAREGERCVVQKIACRMHVELFVFFEFSDKSEPFARLGSARTKYDAPIRAG